MLFIAKDQMMRNGLKSKFGLSRPLMPSDEAKSSIWHDRAIELCQQQDSVLFAAIFAAAPHLHHVAQQLGADELHQILLSPAETIKQALEDWQRACADFKDDDTFMPAVRRLRLKIWFSIAAAELSGHFTMQDSYHYLSLTAETVVNRTVSWICSHSEAMKPMWNGTDFIGYTVLALGKLGAAELNYSSDLDLIILHDSAATGIDRQHFIAMTRRLVHLLSAQTKDGFAFRIDLRLRPDPGATAISIDQAAALTYYESQARTWERAAFIRARPIAGDRTAGQAFLEELQPFIWRRYLDYTVIDDLKIWLQKKPVPAEYFGFDVKNGAHAIRHIELLTHILQLLNGGRHTSLRTNSTHEALEQLAHLNILTKPQSKQLQFLYDAWRCIEHRVQYQRDTHLYRLPRAEEDFEAFARFSGFETASELRRHLGELQGQTASAAHHPVLQKLLESEASQTNIASQATISNHAPNLQDVDLRREWLANIGFENAHSISNIVEGWLSGRIAATRNSRAQQYLIKLLPELFAQLASTDMPDEAFAAFADIIEGQPAGAQIFALLEFHPKLVGLIVDILTSAPQLAEQIRRYPELMESLLDPAFFQELPDTSLQIDSDASIETQLDQIRRQTRPIRFGVSVHQLQRLSDETEIAQAYTELASQAVCHITRLARADMIRRHGRIAAEFALIGLGSLGRYAMNGHSDLDLISIYDGDLNCQSEGDTHGGRSIGLSAYMIRLTQTIVSWLTIHTSEGALYEVDMRLRPDGNAGPLSVHVERLHNYYGSEAWPWEKLAFHSARTITGDDRLISILEKFQEMMKAQPIEPRKLGDNLQTMRAKLHAAFPVDMDKTPWKLKRIAGGSLDCDLLRQLASKYPHIILSQDETKAICRIEFLSYWLQVGLGRKADIEQLPARLGTLMARHMNMPDQQTVRNQLRQDTAMIAQRLETALKLDLGASPETDKHHHNKE